MSGAAGVGSDSERALDAPGPAAVGGGAAGCLQALPFGESRPAERQSCGSGTGSGARCLSRAGGCWAGCARG